MSERLLKLERRIAELEAQLRRPVGGSMPYVNTRPAKAVAGPSSYPGSGNTFYIQFLDGSYTRLTGNQTPTYVGRRAITSTLCHNIRNTLPPENTILEVFEWKGYWWTDFAEGSAAYDDWQKWTGSWYWMRDDDTASYFHPNVEYYAKASPNDDIPMLLWSKDVSGPASPNAIAGQQSATLFRLDESYAACWTNVSSPVIDGNLICVVPGRYQFHFSINVQCYPFSPGGSADSEHENRLSFNYYKNGTLAGGFGDALIPAKRGSGGDYYKLDYQGSVVEAVLAVDDTIGIIPEIINDYVDDDDWGIRPSTFSLSIQLLKPVV